MASASQRASTARSAAARLSAASGFCGAIVAVTSATVGTEVRQGVGAQVAEGDGPAGVCGEPAGRRAGGEPATDRALALDAGVDVQKMLGHVACPNVLVCLVQTTYST